MLTSSTTAAALFHEAIRHLPLRAAVFDRQMQYVAYNDRWAPTFARGEVGSLLGRCHYDAFPEVPDDWRQVHARCLAGATERRELDVFVRADGSRAYVRWVTTPWRDEAGLVAGLIIYSEDITEMVETRQRLDEQELLTRDLFAKSPIGINLARMDGVSLDCNPAFQRITGYTREELQAGVTFNDLTPERYRAGQARQMQLLRSVLRYGPYEKEYIRKDGSLVPVRLNGFIVERDGEPLIWSFVEDMSVQRALETNLEREHLRAIQSSKLATLGEMSAVVAHEVNTPLHVIGSYVDVLEDAIERQDANDTREAMRAIRDATTRAAKIVRSLKRFVGNPAHEPTALISVREVLDEALVLCQARIRTHGVVLTVEGSAEAAVHGHALELSQVLVNLLNNAFDAAIGRAEPWIRLSVLDEPTSGQVVVHVEDSGPGVPVELRPVIFESFFTTKKPGEGTGLGLSISRNIVEQHGGTLTYDDAAPCTRFVIRLPRVDEPHRGLHR